MTRAFILGRDDKQEVDFSTGISGKTQIFPLVATNSTNVVIPIDAKKVIISSVGGATLVSREAPPVISPGPGTDQNAAGVIGARLFILDEMTVGTPSNELHLFAVDNVTLIVEFFG